MNRDPQGHPRDIPVRIGGKHAGLVVWLTPAQNDALLKGEFWLWRTACGSHGDLRLQSDPNIIQMWEAQAAERGPWKYHSCNCIGCCKKCGSCRTNPKHTADYCALLVRQRAELARYMKGLDPLACRVLGKEMEKR